MSELADWEKKVDLVQAHANISNKKNLQKNRNSKPNKNLYQK